MNITFYLLFQLFDSIYNLIL